MSHSVSVTLVADQEIEIQGKVVNIHDIANIVVNGKGVITDAYLVPADNKLSIGWINKGDK